MNPCSHVQDESTPLLRMIVGVQRVVGLDVGSSRERDRLVCSIFRDLADGRGAPTTVEVYRAVHAALRARGRGKDRADAADGERVATLRRMPLEARLALVLHHWEGLSRSELAAVLGRSLSETDEVLASSASMFRALLCYQRDPARYAVTEVG